MSSGVDPPAKILEVRRPLGQKPHSGQGGGGHVSFIVASSSGGTVWTASRYGGLVWMAS